MLTEFLNLVECKVRFISPLYNLSQLCELVVYMKTNCPAEIRFNKLHVRFNLSAYNQFCVLEDSESLFFVSESVREFRFKFAPQKQDIGKELEVSQICLELGNRESRVLAMHWKGDCKNAITAENSTIASFARLVNHKASEEKLDWSSISVSPTTRSALSSFFFRVKEINFFFFCGIKLGVAKGERRTQTGT